MPFELRLLVASQGVEVRYNRGDRQGRPCFFLSSYRFTILLMSQWIFFLSLVRILRQSLHISVISFLESSSGKGVPAALIMAEVRASTHLLASMRIDLENFAQRLNSLVHQSTDKKSFVTLFAAEINTTRQCLSYVNAGHPPPLIYAKNEVRPLAKGTLPLGAQSSLPKLVQRTVEFLPGTMFVSYTDGIPERTNLRGEQYGEERLFEYVRAKAHLESEPFTRQLFEEVKKFGDGKDLEDDVSLAVVKHLTNS